MKLKCHLNFNGNCLEAMNFYKEIFNGDLSIRTYEGTPLESEELNGKVLFANLKFNSNEISASDLVDEELQTGNAYSVLIETNSDEEALNYYEKLSEEGKVIMAYDISFWGSKFAIIKDKFDINWMINYTK